jgi:hypothetical protein
MNLALASTIARTLRDALRMGLIEGRTCESLEGFWNETLDKGSADPAVSAFWGASATGEEPISEDWADWADFRWTWNAVAPFGPPVAIPESPSEFHEKGREARGLKSAAFRSLEIMA